MRRHQRHLTSVLNEHTIMILTLGNPNTSKTANYNNSNKIYKKVRSVIFLYMSLRSEMLKDTYRVRFLWGRCSISLPFLLSLFFLRPFQSGTLSCQLSGLVWSGESGEGGRGAKRVSINQWGSWILSALRQVIFVWTRYLLSEFDGPSTMVKFKKKIGR